ncbi:hypothetical protein AJ80_02083 [Polytolypa hystricis UAMH7299]|uniref:Uncharacterized protein n=1 Tax=Polytolypa hystricis (strain UAMH7299) TaxID=1447883 RepID=A0A2B7YR92_POLH7|nr:hypothetical protein AJ80_02083 [Polytolypa hystricis UAMH7299]
MNPNQHPQQGPTSQPPNFPETLQACPAEAPPVPMIQTYTYCRNGNVHPVPRFYIYRRDGSVVPLIALDELPRWLQVGQEDWCDLRWLAYMSPAASYPVHRVGRYETRIIDPEAASQAVVNPDPQPPDENNQFMAAHGHHAWGTGPSPSPPPPGLPQINSIPEAYAILQQVLQAQAASANGSAVQHGIPGTPPPIGNPINFRGQSSSANPPAFPPTPPATAFNSSSSSGYGSMSSSADSPPYGLPTPFTVFSPSPPPFPGFAPTPQQQFHWPAPPAPQPPEGNPMGLQQTLSAPEYFGGGVQRYPNPLLGSVARTQSCV